MNNYANLLQPTLELAKKAGIVILDYYQRTKAVDIKIKDDASPVTEADLAANKIILQGLKQLTPDIPILSEEAANIPYSKRKQWQQYWLVDPLDGTKEFIHRTDEFTVNIAYIVDGRSKMGIIYAPVTDLFYYAVAGLGAFKQENNQLAERIHTRKIPQDEVLVAVSRRHSVEKAIAFMDKLPNHKKIQKGSSLKTCIIAEGKIDAYPSFGPTSEWDMGAAQCVIEEAGGAMFDLTLNPIQFNTKDSLINPPLLVVGDREYDWGQYL